jgi:hypothetical protein
LECILFIHLIKSNWNLSGATVPLLLAVVNPDLEIRLSRREQNAFLYPQTSAVSPFVSTKNLSQSSSIVQGGCCGSSSNNNNNNNNNKNKNTLL